MSEVNNAPVAEKPDTQGQAVTDQNTQSQAVTDSTAGETYTKDTVERIVRERLKRSEAAWKKEYEERLEQERKRAQMEEAERLKLEKEELTAKVEKMQAELRNARRMAKLMPHVSNVERVLRLIGDSEDYFGEDDTPLVEKIHADFPEYKPVSAQPPVPESAFRKQQATPYSGDLEELARNNPELFNKIWEEQLRGRK